MLEAVIQKIDSLWDEYIKFWFKVYQYQEVVILRNGKYHRTKGPGQYFKWPFFEEAVHVLIIPTTHDLKQQTLVTKDDKTVTVRGMVKAKVDDSKKFALEVYDQVDALGDTTMGIIARLVMDSEYKDLLNSDYNINNQITIKARAAAKPYGIYVMQVTLTEIAPSKALRIFSDKQVVEEVKGSD